MKKVLAFMLALSVFCCVIPYNVAQANDELRPVIFSSRVSKC